MLKEIITDIMCLVVHGVGITFNVKSISQATTVAVVGIDQVGLENGPNVYVYHVDVDITIELIPKTTFGFIYRPQKIRGIFSPLGFFKNLS